MEYLILSSYVDKLCNAFKYSPGKSIRVIPVFRHIPAEVTPVEVPAVSSLIRVQVISIVIQHAYLIAAVQDRDALEHQHPCVEHKVCRNGSIKSIHIS